MYETMKVRLKGMAPMLVHSGRLANPLDPYAKALKQVTSTSKKTDQDLMEASHIEWRAGFYEDEKGRPTIPGECIEAMLLTAGKKKRLGQKLITVLSDGNWPIKYDGPATIDAIDKLTFDKSHAVLDEKFIDVRRVTVNRGSSVMRARPIFRDWSIDFDISYLPKLCGSNDIKTALEIAGFQVGCGDYRPKFGRFHAEIL